MKTWIRQHQLISFFALTYAIMYGVLFTVAFIEPSWFQPWSLAWLLSLFSPIWAALILSSVIGGWDEVKRLLSGYLRWKVGLRWYLATLFLFLGPLAIGLIYVALGNPYPGLNPELTLLGVAGQLFFNVFSGPVAEEGGWRGFALPRLQEKFNALTSSLILGTIWAVWHLPLFFIPGSDQSNIFFPIYLALNIAFSTYITWLYNNTKGSLLIAILAHFCINISMTTIVDRLQLMPSANFYQMTAGPLLGAALVLMVIFFGPRYFSRKPVSELPFQRQ
ncbi:MAG: CPBP family intramembrane metalloprotease [Anaerolineales bacterium]|nr:CPBP family intramembrane metalloprotease [Anaerolineales bacterium]